MSSPVPTSSLEVQPEEVEGALKRIWRDAAKVDEAADAGGDQTTRLRTRLSNLVIVLGPEIPDGHRVINDLITDLCLLFPSRFFIVELDDKDAGDLLKTSVSSRCVLGNSGRHVCSEEIFIRCGRGAVPNVTSLLRSLFVPDVSIFSLYLGDPYAASTDAPVELMRHIGEMCALLLYDSQLAKNYSREAELFFSLRKVPGLSKDAKSLIRVRDLQWYRTERLRMLLAEQFDTGRYRELVPSISKVRFSSPRGPMDAAALLLAGWITAVLGWKVDSKQPDGSVQCSTKKGKKAAVEFAEEKDCFRLTLEGSGNEFTIEFDESQMLFETAARVESSEKIVERRLTVPRSSLAEFIVAPIQSSGLNDHFTRSLECSLSIANVLAPRA